jgi:amino acid adenylation domain-containing protein/thioester reductase-like protein
MIVPDDIADIYALAPMQEGMLFHTLYATGPGVYVQQQTCVLCGELDQAAFRGAWENTVANHPALRTAFLWEQVDKPVQVVFRSVDLPWNVNDLRGLSSQDQQKQLEESLLADRFCDFELGAAPLMRFALIHLADDTIQFRWSFHHLLVDGWSVAILLDEVFERYNASCEGRRPAVVSCPPYRDFIASLAGKDSAAAELYWRDRLAGFSKPTPLPLEHWISVAPTGENAFATVEHIISDQELDIPGLLRAEQLTLSTLVQGAWALLLSRYASEHDVVFGNVTAGRSPELSGSDRMVGLLVNTLPVRICVDPRLRVGEWLRTIQGQESASRTYEQVPLADVLGWSELPRDTPLFNSIVVVENYPNNFSRLELAQGLVISDVRSFESTHYPLTLTVEGTGVVRCRMLFDRRRFEHATVQRLLDDFEFIVHSLLAGMQRPFSALPTLREEEQYRVLLDWNNTDAVFPDNCGVHDLFDLQAQRTPDATAIVDNERSMNYADLQRRANQLANWLHRSGVGRGDHVGLFLERSTDLMVAVLATLKAGAAYVPLDTAYPMARVTAILRDANVRLILSASDLAERLSAIDVPVVCLHELQNAILAEDARPPVLKTSPDDLAYVLYTSGSTGTPKGVAMPHRALCNLIAWQLRASGQTGSGRTLQFSPISFDVSFQEIFSTWCAGGTLVLISEETRRDPERLLAFIACNEIVRLFLPFVALQSLAQAVCDDAGRTTMCLREIITAGEQLHITAQIVQMFELLDGCALHNHYGPTETHVVTAFKLTGPPANWPRLPPIGRPIANVRAYVLDPDMQAVPVGAAGELYVGGVALARDYFNQPGLTAEKFVLDPFSESGEAARLYRTGDRVYWRPDGNLEFLGRSDMQIKLRGYRVELSEIEAVLVTHPAIRQVAVVAHAGETSAATRLVAYVVEAETDSSVPSDLRAFLAERLPEYMVPSVFVRLSSLPLTPSGKLDRRSLPEPAKYASAQSATPRTPTEEVLVQIWLQVLKLPIIGIHDDFFELGGHSLLATQVVARVRQMFAVDLSVRAIFDARTIARLATAVETARLAVQGARMLPLRTAPRDQALPLSFAQERMWFLDQLDPGSSEYNLPICLRCHGDLRASAVEESIATIVSRHEILRTTFDTDSGRPFQVVHATSWPFEIVDMQKRSLTARYDDAMQQAAEFVARPFDLSTGPLGRTLLIQLAPHDHVLVLVLHHIVADGWSLGIFLREFTILYESQLASTPRLLESLPLQYADFAWWQRAWLDGDLLNKQVAYWKEQLDDHPRSLSLLTDRRRNTGRSPQGASEPVHFGPTLTSAIKRLGDEARATMFMTLLAAFQLLLHRVTQDPDILVGTPVANRTQFDLENLIGCFINPVVLRTRFDEPRSFYDLLDLVREESLQAFANQEVPFELIVKSLASTRELNRNPLFQVMFILQNAPLPALKLPRLTMEPIDLGGGSAAFDLLLTMWEAEGELVGLMEYRSDLFDATTIRSLLSRFELLLVNLVADPRQLVSKVPILADEERHRLLIDWNSPDEASLEPCFVPDLVDEQALRTSEGVAVIAAKAQLTYEALIRRSNQLAYWLIRQGVGPGARVGLMLERSEELIVALLGTLKSGAAYVPLDPDSPTERLAWMAKDAGLKLVLTHSELAHRLTDLNVPFWQNDTLREVLDAEDTAAPSLVSMPDDIAYVLYTSGSTGLPKGVEISHRALTNFVTWARDAYELSTADRVLQFASMSFDTSVEEIYPALTCGASVVLRTDEMLGSVAIFLSRVLEWGITVLDLPTGYWHLLTSTMVEQRLAFPPAVRLVILGGEAARAETLLAWQDHVGHGVRLVNTYGPTEATVVATIAELADITREDILSRDVPIGRPIKNVRAYVLDSEMECVPMGSAGEVYLGGAGLASRYLNLPNTTAERFVKNPFDGSRSASLLYRTGDKARWRADGNLEFLGRMDNQVKLRGFRIEPGEIESLLLTHPGVLEAAVVLQGDCATDGPRLVAYVVIRDTLQNVPSELRGFLSTRLPMHMVPSFFVSLSSLPLTASKKLDRRALSELPMGAPAARSYEAPRTDVELAVAAMWAEVLKLERVGLNDSFFDLGGHSLLAAQLLARIETHFEKRLSLRRLFETPTVAGIAAAIETPSEPCAPINIAAALRADALLDASIQPVGPTRLSEMTRVFLTGATGFIGTCLLAELLRGPSIEVCCLVRARDFEQAHTKLHRTLERHGLWESSYLRRIVPVVGDLAKPLLGLSDEEFARLSASINTIYHCGAAVSAIQPYASLRAANVLGTVEVLRLACMGTPKPVHHISTLSIWSTPAYTGLSEITEVTDPIYCEGLEGGHTQSKWVAERLVLSARDRGLPVSIYRPGLVTGDSASGVCKNDDLTLAIARLCVDFKILPAVDFSLDLLPSDYVARAIVTLSREPGNINREFHLFNSRPMSWRTFGNWMQRQGYELNPVTPEDLEMLAERMSMNGDRGSLSPLRVLFENAKGEHSASAGKCAPHPRVDDRHTREGLRDTSITCPPVDEKLLAAYLDYFIRSGFLQPPTLRG